MAKSSLLFAIAGFCLAIPYITGLKTIPSRKLSLSKLSVSEFLDTSTLFQSLLQRTEPDIAKGQFIFFFFGGSGALGIGAAQIPKLLAQFKYIDNLKGGASEGGPDLDINPLALIGFPEPLKLSDVKKIINDFPSTDTILAKGDKKSYMAQLGYMERIGFDRSLPTSNPLARYAIFDAINGGGGDLAAPSDAVQKLQKWRGENGIEEFKSDLLVSTFKKYSAYIFFFGLIALVFDLIIETGSNAFL